MQEKFLKQLPFGVFMAKKSQILLVDDDLFIRDSFKDILELMLSEYDMAIDCAKSGEEALEKVQQQNYDLVLMDTQMGGIAGYNACAQIKEKNPDQTVVGMSSDRGYRKQWLDAGANEFVPKFEFTKSITNILAPYLQKK